MEEYKDIETISYWKKCQELYSGNEPKLAHGKKANQLKVRDHSRTPKQRSNDENAGFCDPGVKPCMRILDDYETVNVESQVRPDDAGMQTMWDSWKFCLANRKVHADVFVYGDFHEINLGMRIYLHTEDAA